MYHVLNSGMNRANEDYVLFLIVRELADILGQPIESMQLMQDDDNDSTPNTIPYGEEQQNVESDDEDLLMPAY